MRLAPAGSAVRDGVLAGLPTRRNSGMRLGSGNEHNRFRHVSFAM